MKVGSIVEGRPSSSRRRRSMPLIAVALFSEFHRAAPPPRLALQRPAQAVPEHPPQRRDWLTTEALIPGRSSAPCLFPRSQLSTTIESCPATTGTRGPNRFLITPLRRLPVDHARLALGVCDQPPGLRRHARPTEVRVAVSASAFAVRLGRPSAGRPPPTRSNSSPAGPPPKSSTAHRSGPNHLRERASTWSSG